MENLAALQVWAVLITAPCILSWIIGEHFGAIRALREIEAAHCDAMPPDCMAHRGPAQTGNCAPLMHTDTDDQRYAPVRRNPFHNMPALDDLRTEAANMRKAGAIWEDPAIARRSQAAYGAMGPENAPEIVRQYLSAVSALNDDETANAGLEIVTLAPDHPGLALTASSEELPALSALSLRRANPT